MATAATMKIARPRRTAASIDMTPMIDCVFQLLIFFMLSSTFLLPRLELSLPEATASGASAAPEQIFISFDGRGRLFLNQDPVTLDSLVTHLEPLVARSKEKVVTVQGDKAAPFDCFVRALAAAQQAGAVRVDVAHEPKNGDASGS
jgi:biopolymer transport protein ExbD